MLRILLLFVIFTSFTSNAEPVDKNVQAIERAILDYIESQHQSNPEIMERGLDKKLAKRTYWQGKDGQEFILETDHDTMVWVAENYNKNGDKFPKSPTVNIDILDIDQRVASVKLTVDDWIDYMHLYQTGKGEWKIINVLWQFHDTSKHVSN